MPNPRRPDAFQFGAFLLLAGAMLLFIVTVVTSIFALSAKMGLTP